ncbi:MAG: hypothetical protein ACRC1K_25190 [Planctomycetia bacterium]
MSLERRIERLERENRRWKRVGLGAVAAAGIALTVGAAPAPRVLEVAGLRLVDAKGKLHGYLSVDAGGPRLFFLGNDGSPKAALVVQGKDANLTVTGSDGKPKVALGTLNEQTYLSLGAATGSASLNLTVSEADGPKVRGFTKDGDGVIAVPGGGSATSTPAPAAVDPEVVPAKKDGADSKAESKSDS